MQIRKILRNVEITGFSNNKLLDMDIDAISFDTRDVAENCVFFCMEGVNFDTHIVAEELYSKYKIAAFITERDLKGVPYIKITNGRIGLSKGLISFLEIDFTKLKSIGITGTNGKTTTSYIIDSIMRCSNYGSMRISTTNYSILGKQYEANNTTPGAAELFRLVAKGIQVGANSLVMEVSSHALEQGRIEGIKFDAAVFTNLTGDHLDYHKSMESYFDAKKKLFTEMYTKSAVVNIDNEYGRKLFEWTNVPKLSCSCESKADIRAFNTIYSLDGIDTKIDLMGDILSIKSHLVGGHNLQNILCAAAGAYSIGIDKYSIKEGIEQLKNVPGRLEKFSGKGAYFFVDYAHTDDALENVLKSLRPYRKNRIITLFGCGGDRDRTKRPRMAATAEKMSDLIIVTSDNPRTENPESIIDEIMEGFEDKSCVVRISDRKAAIKFLYEMAEEGDIALIAGKGHEDYQIVGKVKNHFDDREEISNHIGIKFEKD